MNESIEWYWLWRPRDFTKQLQHDIAEEKLWILLGLQKYGTGMDKFDAKLFGREPTEVPSNVEHSYR